MRDLMLLPKAHLHVHLESTIRWATLREIGAATGLRVPAPPDGPVVFDGFRQFADHNSLVRAVLRRPEDFRRIAVEFCADEAAQGTRYAEVTFTAASHGERLGDPDMPLEAVLDGLAEGQAAYGVECRVILDHSRRRSVERAPYARTGREARSERRHRHRPGGRQSHPLTPFAAVLNAAHDAGLHLIHHAGETCGAESIREAITVGHAERLGHGIRVLDDVDLVAEVRERAIPLEVCPSSNVTLGLCRLLPHASAAAPARCRSAGHRRRRHSVDRRDLPDRGVRPCPRGVRLRRRDARGPVADGRRRVLRAGRDQGAPAPGDGRLAGRGRRPRR